MDGWGDDINVGAKCEGFKLYRQKSMFKRQQVFILYLKRILKLPKTIHLIEQDILIARA